MYGREQPVFVVGHAGWRADDRRLNQHRAGHVAAALSDGLSNVVVLEAVLANELAGVGVLLPCAGNGQRHERDRGPAIAEHDSTHTPHADARGERDDTRQRDDAALGDFALGGGEKWEIREWERREPQRQRRQARARRCLAPQQERQDAERHHEHGDESH